MKMVKWDESKESYLIELVDRRSELKNGWYTIARMLNERFGICSTPNGCRSRATTIRQRRRVFTQN